jgi:hypothetical protein
MAIIASLFRAPETPQSASTAAPGPREIEQDGPQLLELHTETGTVYLLPSRWQRIRLQWAFRHFRVLPPQLLSRGDMRLIEKLSQSAVVTPPLPVRSNVVFGVVEQPRSKPPASANRAVAPRTALAATQEFLAKPEISELPSVVLSLVAKQRAAKQAADRTKTTEVRYLPFRQWRDLGTLAAAGLIVIVASVYWAPRFSNAVQMRDRRTRSTSIKHSANDIKPTSLHPAATSLLPAPPATSSLANAEKPKRSAAPPQPGPVLARQEPALVANKVRQSMNTGRASGYPLSALDTVSAIPQLALVAPSAAPARRFVADLPPGYFARPFVSDGNLVGEGGMPAVRQWHYSPYQVLGSSVAAETLSKMSFLAPDAVSTAAAAHRPTSQAK